MAKELRYSKQREAVLKAVKECTCHPTADTVYAWIREEYPKVSLATVYRNLNLLVEIQQLRCIQDDNGVQHFDGTCNEHAHFVCDTCHNVLDIGGPEKMSIQHLGLDLKGHHIAHTSITLHGTCKNCRKLSAC